MSCHLRCLCISHTAQGMGSSGQPWNKSQLQPWCFQLPTSLPLLCSHLQTDGQKTPGEMCCKRNKLNLLPPMYTSWSSFTLSMKTHNSQHSVYMNVTGDVQTCNILWGGCGEGLFWFGFNSTVQWSKGRRNPYNQTGLVSSTPASSSLFLQGTVWTVPLKESSHAQTS